MAIILFSILGKETQKLEKPQTNTSNALGCDGVDGYEEDAVPLVGIYSHLRFLLKMSGRILSLRTCSSLDRTAKLDSGFPTFEYSALNYSIRLFCERVGGWSEQRIGDGDGQAAVEKTLFLTIKASSNCGPGNMH